MIARITKGSDVFELDVVEVVVDKQKILVGDLSYPSTQSAGVYTDPPKREVFDILKHQDAVTLTVKVRRGSWITGWGTEPNYSHIVVNEIYDLFDEGNAFKFELLSDTLAGNVAVSDPDNEVVLKWDDAIAGEGGYPSKVNMKFSATEMGSEIESNKATDDSDILPHGYPRWWSMTLNFIKATHIVTS